MPISKSAKKALRVQLRRTALNRHRKVLVRAAVKNATKETLPKAISLIDKAVKWHLIHKNKAARAKSSLMRQVGVTPGVTKTGSAKSTKKAATKKPAARKNSKH